MQVFVSDFLARNVRALDTRTGAVWSIAGNTSAPASALTPDAAVAVDASIGAAQRLALDPGRPRIFVAVSGG